MTLTPRAVVPTPAAAVEGILRSLRELIAALDRRVPIADAAGEVEIARVAAVLRGEALKRIAELEQLVRPAPGGSGQELQNGELGVAFEAKTSSARAHAGGPRAGSPYSQHGARWIC